MVTVIYNGGHLGLSRKTGIDNDRYLGTGKQANHLGPYIKNSIESIRQHRPFWTWHELHHCCYVTSTDNGGHLGSSISVCHNYHHCYSNWQKLPSWIKPKVCHNYFQVIATNNGDHLESVMKACHPWCHGHKVRRWHPYWIRYQGGVIQDFWCLVWNATLPDQG